MVDRHTLSLDCHSVSHCFFYINDSVTVCDSIYIDMGKYRNIGEYRRTRVKRPRIWKMLSQPSHTDTKKCVFLLKSNG